ncbi:MAG: cob(I)yrinic acid a,c-diamide adenosyltransferase [Planctomycetaceae bacterium]|jgi:cob(I)alamin adenosyltransferase|nr:cob(I)yrinic acid a,c-diamide adenosyltransferase [Planctomycetaceae bacterium]
MIYTRGGDNGSTALAGGLRVSKTDLRIEVNGQLDELSAVLGIVRSEGLHRQYAEIVLRIQKELSGLCAEIAGSEKTFITDETVKALEVDIDTLSVNLPPLKQFSVLGDSRPSAYLHLARTVCRRAERYSVQLFLTESGKHGFPLSYLNRLSDLLFVLAEKTK